MKYSEGFRNSVLRKVLPTENRSANSVAKEMGVSAITIQSWIRKLKDGS
jgi:transposase